MRSALHVLIPFCKNMRTSSALTSGRRILARTWGSDLRLAYWTVMVVVGAARYAKSFLGLRSLAPRRTISRWNLLPCALPSEYPQLSNESQRGLCCCDFQRRRERISCPRDGKHAATMLYGNKVSSWQRQSLCLVILGSLHWRPHWRILAMTLLAWTRWLLVLGLLHWLRLPRWDM